MMLGQVFPWPLGEIEARGAEALVPSRRIRTESRDHVREMHKRRHRIENFIARIKGVPCGGDAV